MHKHLFTLLLIVFFVPANAQLIDSRVNIYSGYSAGSFPGSETVTEGQFISPSLYSNFNDLSGYRLKGLYRLKPFLSTGLEINYHQGSGWHSSSSLLYRDSELEIFAASTVFQFHTTFKETGILNRIKPFVEISPTLGFSALTLANPVFEIHGFDHLASSPTSSTDFIYGVKGNIGLEVSVNRFMGSFISWSYQHIGVESILYNDNSFSVSQFEIGLFFKLLKNRRFYY